VASLNKLAVRVAWREMHIALSGRNFSERRGISPARRNREKSPSPFSGAAATARARIVAGRACT